MHLTRMSIDGIDAHSYVLIKYHRSVSDTLAGLLQCIRTIDSIVPTLGRDYISCDTDQEDEANSKDGFPCSIDHWYQEYIKLH